MTPKTRGTGAEHRHASSTHRRLTSVVAVLADGEMTPPQKLDFLTGWDARHGTTRKEGYGRVADAANLGFPDLSSYSPEVQRAVVELYRLHRKVLPGPETGPWRPSTPPTAE